MADIHPLDDDDTGEVHIDVGETVPEDHYFELHYATNRLPYIYVEVGGRRIIEGYVIAGIPPRQQTRKRWRS